jgi:hypothetical protein
MTVNPTKSNVVQFRTPSVPRSCTEFKSGDNIIHYADCYSYLGLVLNKFLDYTTLLFVGLTVIQLSSHQVASAFNNVCNAFSLLAKITISSA